MNTLPIECEGGDPALGLVIPAQDETRVYPTHSGQVAITQIDSNTGEQSLVLIPKRHLGTIIEAMRAAGDELGDVQA